jgi:hypothetical protein
MNGDERLAGRRVPDVDGAVQAARAGHSTAVRRERRVRPVAAADRLRLPPADLETSNERGLRLMRAFMDEVRHNAAGNEITLVKRNSLGGGKERFLNRGLQV